MHSSNATVEPEILTEEETRERLSPLWRVICHDDPITTMDFVVEVLRSVFRISQARAVELMYRVHHTGSAVIGHWPEEAARRKVERATSLARGRGYPLTFTIEEAE